MAVEGTTFYDGAVNLSWGTGGNPEVVAAPPAVRSSNLLRAIAAGSVVETADPVTAIPNPVQPNYIRISAAPSDGDTIIFNSETGKYDPAPSGGGGTEFGRSLLSLEDAAALRSVVGPEGLGTAVLVNEYIGAKSDNQGGAVALPFVPTAGNCIVVVSALEDGSGSWTTAGWTNLIGVAESGNAPAIYCRHKVSAGNETGLDFQGGTGSSRQFNWWFGEFANAAAPIVSAVELTLQTNGFPVLVIPSTSLVMAFAFGAEGRSPLTWTLPFARVADFKNPRDGGTRPQSSIARIGTPVGVGSVHAIAAGWGDNWDLSIPYRGFTLAVPKASIA